MAEMFRSRPQLRKLSGESSSSDRRSRHPSKLKDDSITEAVFEMRFATPDSDDLEEITIGRLLESDAWKEYTRKRLAFADIPRPLRQANEQLRYQPTAELLAADNSRRVRVGPSVISSHAVGSYQGWQAFFPHVSQLVENFYEKVPAGRVKRLGLRYVNALTATRHGIGSVGELKIDLRVVDHRIDDRMNLNFITAKPPSHEIATRIATPDFVQGNKIPDAKVFIDIDVYSSPNVEHGSKESVLDWIGEAHDHALDAFFQLIPNDVIEKLREK